MIQDILNRLRAEAVAYGAIRSLQLAGVLSALNDGERAALAAYLCVAYIAGADAGYASRCAEERRK